jgi:hypothetical protein
MSGHGLGKKDCGMRIGKDQLKMLVMLGTPTRSLITPGKSERGMIAKGLLRQDDGGACCITPAGLRVLADEIEAGRVDDALERMKAEAELRKSPHANGERRDK